MRANRIPLAMLMLFVAANVGAQTYKWVDQDGKVRYGDTPPPGAKVSPLQSPSAAATQAPAPTPKDAKKGPLTPAEEEQAFRKRQAVAGKESEKSEAERRANAEREEACERTREYLTTLRSGQRIMRTSASGERYYLDESQTAQEIAKEQQKLQQANCR